MALTVSRVQVLNSKQVKLTIQEMRDGASYQLTVSNVEDINGNVIDPGNATEEFEGIGVSPQLVSAVYVDITHIDLTFNEAIADDTNTSNPDNYIITGQGTPGVTTATISEDGLTVHLALDEDLETGTYNVEVQNLVDLGGNPIDSAHDDDSFTQTVGPWGDYGDLDVGLIAHYPMEGNAEDAYTNGYDGSFPASSPHSDTGKIDNCLHFDGSTVHMAIAHNTRFDSMNAHSISFWVKIPTIAGNMFLHTCAGRRGQSVVGVLSADIYVNHVWWGTEHHNEGGDSFSQTLSESVLTDNTWYHIVVTFNGAETKKIYLNGTIDKTDLWWAPLTLLDPTHPIRVAVSQNSLIQDGNEDLSFDMRNGYIDELTFWDRELTGTEAAYLYNTGSGRHF